MGEKRSRPWNVGAGARARAAACLVEKEIAARHRPCHAAGAQLRSQQSVVGSDEDVRAGFDDEETAVATDAGIDHREVHRPWRKCRRRGREQVGRALDVARLDLVRQIDELRPRREAQHRSLHRANVVVGEPEVGEQRQDARHAMATLADRET